LSSRLDLLSFELDLITQAVFLLDSALRLVGN